MIETLPADLVFCSGRSWLSGSIRWASRTKGEPETYANHVGIFVGGDYVVESLWRTVKHTYANVSSPNQIWRNTKLSDWQRAIVATKARSYVGRQYGVAKIVPHLQDALLGKMFGGNPYIFRRLNHLDDFPICSWSASFSFAAVDYTFGVPPEMAQPDDMHDWCMSHPDHWRMIYEERA